VSSLTGQDLGQYHILEQLGEGGMATVYKAFDTRLERNVAVKIIRREAFAQGQMERILKRFEREARTLAKLTHPNIVKILDHGEHEGTPYLVLEYIPAGTLKDYLAKLPNKMMPWREAARLLLPVARALHAAHQQGIIHRDVKPSNILITQSGEPMLTDFGIAKLLDVEETHTLTGTGVGIGTPEYMSPEQGTGEELDARADVYSLGIVFYEMITGRKPYTATTPMAVIIKHVNDPLPRPTTFVPNLPEKVEQTLIKALAKKPENRFADMAAFARTLEALPGQSAEDAATLDQALTAGQTVDRLSSTAVPRPATGPRPDTRSRVVKWLPLIIAAVCICSAAAVGGGYAAYKAFVQPTPTQAGGPSVVPPAPDNGGPTITLTASVSPLADITITPSLTTAITETPSLTPLPQAGDSIISPKDGMELVYIPAGNFIMGATSGDPNAGSYEMPQHTVSLSAFRMDRTEVTNAMFAAFVQATGYITDAEYGGTGTVLDFNQSGSPWVNDYPGANWRTPLITGAGISGLDRRPVVQVSWNDAAAYCNWAGRRLPTEAEWEKAARGADGRLYPWGSTDPGPGLLNFNRQAGSLTDVGSYPAGASPYGILDMLGNAYEWVADWYDPSYYSKSPATDPQGPASGSFHVIRGGGWNYGLDWTRTTSRSKLAADYRVETLGFRCAISVIP
jgi:eukaryotic-like serine/threonine-protein kinase